MPAPKGAHRDGVAQHAHQLAARELRRRLVQLQAALQLDLRSETGGEQQALMLTPSGKPVLKCKLPG
jgi:hypothetical protein